MPPKIRVGVIFGGRSAEHQVSLVSATSIMNALDKEKYEVIPIGITPEGKWLSSPDAVQLLKSGDPASGIEKILTKQLCEQADIQVTPYVWFTDAEFRAKPGRCVALIEKKLRYPTFVKPSNSGSSVGISKAHNRRELTAAIELALHYDRKILIEKGIEHAREIEVSVLGNDDPAASVPGEIVSSNEFYDYDAKYVDGKSTAIIPAQLPKPVVRKIRDI